MHRKMCIVTVVLLILFSGNNIAQPNNSDSLTIEMAVSRAIENNPELKLILNEINALEAVKVQSGLFPNPEFQLEAENVLGSGDFSGFRGSEITASLSQDILLAGKISKQEKVAEMDISLAEWDYEAKRIEVITNVRRAFGQALTTQKLIKMNNELIKISEEFIANLKARVEAGKISPAEVSRARIIFNSLQIQLNRLKSDYEASISELKTLMNDPNISFTQLKGEIAYPLETPVYDSLLVQLENNPNLKRYETEYSKQKAVIDFEESKSVPDLTLSAGYRRLNEINANTFVLGASIPLPIFNRNQGSIQEAQIRFDQKKNEYETVKNNLTLRLSFLFNQFDALLKNAEQLKKESIPDAEETFKIIKEGNLVGRFTILDVLDTQRTLFVIQNQYLNTISDIHIVKTEIEGLIGKEIK